MSRVAIYARVSTSDQSTDAQLLDLRHYIFHRGWRIFCEYCDSGISGSRDSRPALNQLMGDARKRRFDVVLVWRFDRFARSTKHLILALEEFRNLGIDFVSYQENVDTSSPLGGAIFTIISAVAQLERDIIADRVKAGLRRARARGVGCWPRRRQHCSDGFMHNLARGRKVATRVGVNKGLVWMVANGQIQSPKVSKKLNRNHRRLWESSDSRFLEVIRKAAVPWLLKRDRDLVFAVNESPDNSEEGHYEVG